MAMTSQIRFAQSLRRLATEADPASDAELLGRFLAEGNQAAFTTLVRRHANMVFGVCRRLLSNLQDAEDAFQATYLVLARKAHAIGDRAALSCWLHGVAYRTALKARSAIAKRCAKETPMAVETLMAAPSRDHSADLEELLDRELEGLTEKYRLPVVLCDLEGLSRRMAAERLGVSEGTLSGQLFRGRRLLAQRLRRHGLVMSAGTLATILGQNAARAAPSAAMVEATVNLGLADLTGAAAMAGSVSSSVLSLTNGVIKIMYVQKLKQMTILGVALVAALGIGWATLVQGTWGANQAPGGFQPAGENKNAPAPEVLTDPGMEGVADLLRHRKVLRELKCTVEQWNKLEDILEAADKNVQMAQAAMGNVPPPVGADGQPDFMVVHKQMMQVAAMEYQKAAKDIYANVFKPEQVKRFLQLEVQSHGVAAFQNKKIVAALKLTAKQKEQIQGLITQMQKDQQDLLGKMAQGGVVFGGPGGVIGGAVQIFDPNNKETQAIAAKTQKAIEGLLTKEQEKTWRDQVGAPAAFPLQNRFGGSATMPGINIVVPALPAVPLPAPAPAPK